MSIIRLLVLQTQLLKQSAVRVVNLTQDEAVAFLKSCNKYSEVEHFILFAHLFSVLRVHSVGDEMGVRPMKRVVQIKNYRKFTIGRAI